MSLKFLADHCVPNSIIKIRESDGHYVHRLREFLPTNSPDQVVISKAKEQQAILLSLNGDFGDIVAYPPSNYSGIVCIQVKNRPGLVPLLLSNFRRYIAVNPKQEDYSGKLVTVDVHRIRVKT